MDGRTVCTARVRAEMAGWDHGFTVIEVLVAAILLVVGLGALLGMLVTANHAISTTRLRQEGTSIARELLEDSRGLAYTQLTSGTIASALQPQLPGASLSGTNLTITRSVNGLANTSFNVAFNVCSLDDPSNGYGNHNLPPNSGGVWCPDVAPNGSADSNPDDYKRLSVTVAPTNRGTPVVQQTILIYQQPVNGPAVTCLSTTASCPGLERHGDDRNVVVDLQRDDHRARRPHPMARQRKPTNGRANLRWPS